MAKKIYMVEIGIKDWDIAPEWANFSCIHANGIFEWFEFEPKFNEKTGFWERGFYDVPGRHEQVSQLTIARNSLVSRPGVRLLPLKSEEN